MSLGERLSSSEDCLPWGEVIHSSEGFTVLCPLERDCPVSLGEEVVLGVNSTVFLAVQFSGAPSLGRSKDG